MGQNDCSKGWELIGVGVLWSGNWSYRDIGVECGVFAERVEVAGGLDGDGGEMSWASRCGCYKIRLMEKCEEC